MTEIAAEITTSLNSNFLFFQTPSQGKDKPQAGPSKSPSLSEIKNKLTTAAKEVRPSFFFFYSKVFLFTDWSVLI